MIKNKNLFLLLLAFLAAMYLKSAYSDYIFVSNENSDSVTILDEKNKKIIKSISTGGRPRDMKFSKDKTKLYIVVSEENHIAILNLNKLKITGYIKTGDDPEIFDISPNGKLLAVSNEDDNELTIIDLSTKKILKSIQNVGVEPEGVNFSPDGRFVFVTSEGTNSVIIVDPWKQEIINEILVGNRPRRGIFVNEGSEYWVSNELNGSVSIINTKNLEIIKTISFSVKGIKSQDITPVDFAYSKKLEKVFVTLGSANHVAVVNTKSHDVENNILVGSRVWGAALTRNDKELIVTNGNSDDISVIDLKKLVAISSIPVGKTPHTVRVLK